MTAAVIKAPSAELARNSQAPQPFPKLAAVKKKYDPDGLFFVHHGVGSEEWSADGFTRLAPR